MYFSYQTCGATNTFSSWFGGDAGSGDTGSDTHTLDELVGVIRGYLSSAVETLESNQPEISTSSSCSPDGSCPCASCVAANWSSAALDFQTTTFTPRTGASPTSDAGVLESCMGDFLDNAFTRVAALEADTSRIGYEYAAFQAQGAYVQWPGTEFCPGSYDPRCVRPLDSAHRPLGHTALSLL